MIHKRVTIPKDNLFLTKYIDLRNTIALIFSRKPSLSTDGGFNDTSVQSGAH